MIKDSYDLWVEHQAQLDKALERLPRCVECDEYIQGHWYEINGGTVCPDCLESNYRKEADDFSE